MEKNIIHLITSLKRGGRERQLATIVSNTDFKKYPTKILYFNDNISTYFSEYALKQHSIKIKSTMFFPRLIEFNKLIKKTKPNVIYTWGNLESIFTILLSPFHTFKFINGSIRHGIRSLKFSHYFRSVILHLSQNVVSNSYAGLKANNLNKGQVLYNGIDDKFIWKLSKQEKIKKKKKVLNIEQNIPVIISVANLVPYKDYYSVLKALKLIKDEGYKFHYLILGDGPLRKNIEQKIKEFDLSKNAKIIGTVENVHEYLQLSDIFIHSSKGEGCSNAILESMAVGLPIIASKTGGTPEIVTEENGFLFEYKNFYQLFKALEWCFENYDDCKKMGYNSNKKIKDKFSVNSMIQKYYRIINS